MSTDFFIHNIGKDLFVPGSNSYILAFLPRVGFPQRKGERVQIGSCQGGKEMAGDSKAWGQRQGQAQEGARSHGPGEESHLRETLQKEGSERLFSVTHIIK